MNQKNKLLLFAVIITTIIVSTFALSKYQSTNSLKSSTSPAIPVISLTSNTLNVNLEINPVDKEQDYIFQVANYENNTISDNVSEVTMKYNLQIKTLDILPLDFELYDYDQDAGKLVGENLLINSTSSNAVIGFGERQTKTYLLKIKWKDGLDNYLYSKEIDCLQLVLNSEQVD